MQILYLKVKKSTFLLHMVCDVIGIAQHLFETAGADFNL